MFKDADADRNGKIKWDELLVFIKALSSGKKPAPEKIPSGILKDLLPGGIDYLIKSTSRAAQVSTTPAPSCTTMGHRGPTSLLLSRRRPS